jgi:hypothetical protein
MRRVNAALTQRNSLWVKSGTLGCRCDAKSVADGDSRRCPAADSHENRKWSAVASSGGKRSAIPPQDAGFFGAPGVRGAAPNQVIGVPSICCWCYCTLYRQKWVGIGSKRRSCERDRRPILTTPRALSSHAGNSRAPNVRYGMGAAERWKLRVRFAPESGHDCQRRGYFTSESCRGSR